MGAMSFNRVRLRNYIYFLCNECFQGRQRPPNNNYVPEVCDLDDLYKEDLECAEKYRQVADDDDDVHVSGHHVSAEVIE